MWVKVTTLSFQCKLIIYYNAQLILLRLPSRYHGKKDQKCFFGYNPGVDLPALSKSSLGPSGN